MAEHRELLLNPETQAELTIGLYREGLFGIRENPDDYITLKSKRLSPHYLDIRPGISNIATRDLVIGSMIDLANHRVDPKGLFAMETAYDHVAGTPEAMTSYAAMLAYVTDMSLLQPRVDMAKQTGNTTPILGKYNKGDKVAEFDDVVTDGKSKIDTIKGLAQAGLEVVDYFVVVDREEGGAPQVKSETDLEITPALAVSSMIRILREESLISGTQFDNVVEYMQQYGDPSAKASLGLTT